MKHLYITIAEILYVVIAFLVPHINFAVFFTMIFLTPFKEFIAASLQVKNPIIFGIVISSIINFIFAYLVCCAILRTNRLFKQQKSEAANQKNK